MEKQKQLNKFTLTSLISLILQPPLPIREPHWLAGTTMRSVTGGFEVAVLLDMELLISWKMAEGGGKSELLLAVTKLSFNTYISQ